MAWKQSTALLVHLLFKMVEKDLIIPHNRKMYFNYIKSIFDYTEKSNESFRLSELRSRMKKDIEKNQQHYKVEQDFVKNLLDEITIN